MLHQVFDFLTVFHRDAEACGVWDVHNGGSGLDHGIHHAGQILVVGAACIFGVEFYILHITLGIFHGGHSPFYDFFGCAVKLVPDVAFARAYTRVDALVLGILQGIGSHINILLHRTCQRTDGGPCDGLADFHYRIEVAGAADGKTGLNHVYPQCFQLAGHLNLLHRVQLAAGHLLAVAQCGVKDVQFIAHILVWIIFLLFFRLQNYKIKLAYPNKYAEYRSNIRNYVPKVFLFPDYCCNFVR